MAVLDKKVSQLITLANVSSDDLLMVVNDPDGSPTSRKITVGAFFGNASIDSTFTGLSIKDRMQVANVTSAIAASKIDILETSTRNARLGGVIVHSANVLTTSTAQTVFATTLSANTINVRDVNANTVTANVNLILPNPTEDPATSNATTESISAGTIFYSNTHLYIATDENTIKRIALSDF